MMHLSIRAPTEPRVAQATAPALLIGLQQQLEMLPFQLRHSHRVPGGQKPKGQAIPGRRVKNI